MAKKKIEEKQLNEDPDYGANAASVQMHPIADTKTAAMGALMGIFQQLSQEDALNFLNLMLQQIGHEADLVPDGIHMHNQASVSMKPSDAVGSMRETYEADVLALFGDNKDLAEEHKERALTLFEAALNSRLALETATIEEAYQEQLEEEVAQVSEFFEEKINEYLTYGMREWLKENEVAVTNTLAAEKATEFFEDLIGLCHYHNISVPDDQIDVVEELTARVEELTSQVNEAVAKVIDLSDELEEYQKEAVIDNVSEGLALTQKEKLRTMVGSFQLNEDFAGKVKTVRDQHFALSKGPKDSGILNENVNEDTGTHTKPVMHPGMNRYVQALSLTAKSISSKKSA